MIVLVIDLCWEKDSLSYHEFVSPVVRIVESAGAHAVVCHRSQPLPSDVDCAILCGTALRDNAFLDDASLMHAVRALRVPLLGICAGAEALATGEGKTLSATKEIGMTQVTRVRESTVFSMPASFHAFGLHGFAVDAPANMVIAASPACAQLMHLGRDTYGVMFHPEVRNEWVIKEFLLFYSKK